MRPGGSPIEAVLDWYEGVGNGWIYGDLTTGQGVGGSAACWLAGAARRKFETTYPLLGGWWTADGGERTDRAAVERQKIANE